MYISYLVIPGYSWLISGSFQHEASWLHDWYFSFVMPSIFSICWYSQLLTKLHGVAWCNILRLADHACLIITRTTTRILPACGLCQIGLGLLPRTWTCLNMAPSFGYERDWKGTVAWFAKLCFVLGSNMFQFFQQLLDQSRYSQIILDISRSWVVLLQFVFRTTSSWEWSTAISKTVTEWPVSERVSRRQGRSVWFRFGMVWGCL